MLTHAQSVFGTRLTERARLMRRATFTTHAHHVVQTMRIIIVSMNFHFMFIFLPSWFLRCHLTILALKIAMMRVLLAERHAIWVIFSCPQSAVSLQTYWFRLTSERAISLISRCQRANERGLA